MARLILKSPYLKPGHDQSPGGYLQYIATREGVEMAEDTSRHLPSTAEQQKEIAKLIKQHPDSKESHEYEDYLHAPTRGNADAFIQSVFELYGDPQRDVYLKYIDERPGSNGLFTDEGVPIVLSQVQKEMNESQSNIWTHIISLRREDAERLGYNSPEMWMYLLRSQRNMIAQQMKIAPENFRWYAAFHNEGHHPHVHMMAYSVDPKEAYLTKQGIETIKSNLAKEIFRQDLLQIYQKQTDLRDELRQASRKRMEEIVTEIDNGNIPLPDIAQLLIQLSDRLSKHKGKKQYGYLNTGTKKLVDEIVAILAADQRIQELYSLWYDLREDVLRTYTDKMPERIPLAQQKEFKSIRNTVVQAAQRIIVPIIAPAVAPALPCVDFSGNGEDEYQAAKEWLCEPRVPFREEVEKQLYDAAIRGSVDAIYGTGMLHLKTDPATAIGYFELAAKQGHSYAEYQLGRIYCFSLGVPQNLEAGMEWLKASAGHGNEHAATLLSRVQQGLQNVALNAASGLLCSLANMLQASGEQNFQKRLRADRKQISKTAQKKQAQGLHHQEEYQGLTMV